MSYQIVKADTTEEALEKSSYRVGESVTIHEITASANSNKTYSVRVTEFSAESYECNQFLNSIDRMNNVFKTGFNTVPVYLSNERMEAFHGILSDEVDEIREGITELKNIDKLVALADTLGDVMVYCASEARRWGIPIDRVLQIIMESQTSKLVDGKPLWNAEGTKFIKGPQYVAPEPRIRQLLLDLNPAI